MTGTTPTGRTVVANIALSLDGRVCGPDGDDDMSWIVPHAVADGSRDHMTKPRPRSASSSGDEASGETEPEGNRGTAQGVRRAMASAARWSSTPRAGTRSSGRSVNVPVTWTAAVAPFGSGTGAATEAMPGSRSPRAWE